MTETVYDSLGRVTSVWLPNRSRALGKTANYVYAYSVRSDALPWVSSASLKGDGSGYNTTYEIYDSLLRTRQVQAPSAAGGRIIAQTLYDGRGLAVTAQADIWDSTSAPSGTIVQIDGGQAPKQTDSVYDGMARVTKRPPRPTASPSGRSTPPTRRHGPHQRPGRRHGQRGGHQRARPDRGTP